MHGLITCNINAGVTQRCHNRNPRWETGLRSANDVTHRKRAKDFGRFEKVSWLSWVPGSEEDGWLSGVVEARWKKQDRKNVYLSPYVEEPLNSKVIKSFVPELRSRKCFSCFEIPMFYIYIYIYIRTLWTFCVPVWICPFHIFIYGYVTIFTKCEQY